MLVEAGLTVVVARAQGQDPMLPKTGWVDIDVLPKADC